MIQARPIISRPHSSEIEAVNYLTVADSPIDRILQKISKMELPEQGALRELHAPQVENEPQAKHS